jgi:cysteine synthase
MKDKDKEKILANTAARLREKNIIIPTYEEMADPEKIPEKLKEELTEIGLWDLNPRNLFRICWKNEPVSSGGRYGPVNFIEIPQELTGIKARIIVLIGKYFPTGSHKVGATFGPLVERLVTGSFDPTSQKALWPSTGNYGRGGAYDSSLLGCPSIVVLPEDMSKERFKWLRQLGAEVYATPGSESNVREVFEKSYDLKRQSPEEVIVLNQFAEFGNAVWHYVCTGRAIEEVFLNEDQDKYALAAIFLTQGSAGTLASADYLREKFPFIKVGAGEALQCPTLLLSGYGEHRIEGIGDKHVPWIHNLKNMDMAAAIDDEQCIRLLRLFNEEKGQMLLRTKGLPDETIHNLPLLGISSIANLVGCIKMAKYYEMNEKDIIFTVATDSMDLYQSRLKQLDDERGPYTEHQAAIDYDSCLMALTTDHMLELTYREKKRIHNMKYFTWIEQWGKEVKELDRQWYDDSYWKEKYRSFKKWDTLISKFNEHVGVIDKYL